MLLILHRSNKCDVPQRSILRPLLFLICVNDLGNASNILNPRMFADDTNHFFIKIFTLFLKLGSGSKQKNYP